MSDKRNEEIGMFVATFVYIGSILICMIFPVCFKRWCVSGIQTQEQNNQQANAEYEKSHAICDNV